MLLYEFAMIPDVFEHSTLKNDQSLEFIFVVQFLRGLSENGLLANLYKDQWYKDVNSQISNLPQELKGQIMACLNMLDSRHRLVRHPKQGGQVPAHSVDWLNLAMISHQKIPFHGIIFHKGSFEDDSLADNVLIELSKILNSSQWQNRRRSLTLKKREKDYRKNLTPILRYARSLTLVDPYFNHSEARFFDTIQLCSELMGQRPGLDRRQGRIHIHAAKKHQEPEDRSLEEYLASWKDKLSELNCKDGHRFKIFLWESSSETLHDRFILTDQCGISTPGGLDCRTQSNPNDTVWSLLDEEDRRLWLQKFDPQAKKSPYQLLGDREIGSSQ